MFLSYLSQFYRVLPKMVDKIQLYDLFSLYYKYYVSFRLDLLKKEVSGKLPIKLTILTDIVTKLFDCK